MTQRDTELLKITAAEIGIISEHNSTDENFQNSALRPILKLQNDLFIEVFIQYAIKNKNVFFKLDLSKKQAYIDYALVKDFKFRYFLIGLVVGLFKLNEIKYYNANSAAVNRRIITMLAERLKSNLQLLVLNDLADLK